MRRNTTGDHIMRSRRIVCLAAVGAVAVFASTPANAAELIGLNQYKVDAPAGSVTGSCGYVTTIPGPSFNTIRVVISYQVSADAPAWAVAGVCEVRDRNAGTGTVSYGEVRASGPGMYATNAGYVDVPRNILQPVTCNIPEALFLDGSEANPANLRQCRPL